MSIVHTVHLQSSSWDRGSGLPSVSNGPQYYSEVHPRIFSSNPNSREMKPSRTGQTFTSLSLNRHFSHRASLPFTLPSSLLLLCLQTPGLCSLGGLSLLSYLVLLLLTIAASIRGSRHHHCHLSHMPLGCFFCHHLVGWLRIITTSTSS